jgi:hypothetical protein
VRLLLAFLFGLLGDNPVSINARASMIVVGIVFVLSYITARSYNEDIFLANLGTPHCVLVMLCAGPPAALEIAVGIMPWV